MKRRGLIGALGAVAAGGVGAVGTGAFTSVDADRTVSVTIAEENEAYLGLAPSGGSNGTFAQQTGAASGELYLDFNGAGPVVEGTGAGPDSVYEFDNVFTVDNQGTQTTYVNIDKIEYDSSGDGSDDLSIEFYVGDDPSTPLQDNDLELATGDSGEIGVRIDLSDDSAATGGSLSGETTVSATDETDDGSPISG